MTPPPELKIVPALATSWEVLDEGKTYVFHLVEGVKFHDGTDFDAEAAKWNFDRILTPRREVVGTDLLRRNRTRRGRG